MELVNGIAGVLAFVRNIKKQLIGKIGIVLCIVYYVWVILQAYQRFNAHIFDK